ncbi:tripartite tricarboxylate transporter TctB family protein [Aquabacterium sp. A7-Y]|uniref:tripartite tricarboxylate transporter TctB family protein n=1 Tax=Aquabacterium sp. A7-Y TaxID=1349605 RepID=UPI00223CAC8A|nr:tripartite tricarboxylate transporter TctB family protein [Aquabacterium sp. A7-Y]MCW7536398.1 tripartite tricarboxylate transporter TctB family protein [Aquabacterium sp. A7-Y]
MKIKSQRDFVSGLMFIVVGLGFAWGATNYSFGSSASPGPGYFPFGLGLILAVLGAMVTFKSLTIETEDGDPIGAIAWKPLLLILGAVAVFGFALPRLGLIITIALLVGLASLAGDEIKWKQTAILAVVLMVGCYLVFVKGLSLVLPMWPSFLG